MPRLTFISPEFAEQSCELPDGKFTLGRSRRNHIVVLDESVSAQHCELLVYGAEVIVRECGSRNGTFVGGIRVKDQSGVYHGQHLRFGRLEAILHIGWASNEGDSDITAFHDHCRAMQRAAAPTPELPRFPVIFTS